MTLISQTAAQRKSDALNQLQGNPELPIEQFPAYMQASAALEQAQASRCPASDSEVIEIRQVQEMSDFPADVKEAAAGFAELQKQAGKKG